VELGVDLGTSSTVAFLRRAGGPPEPVLFDGAPLLPSAVHAGDTGGLRDFLVGRDAVHAARAHPERFEGNPKRRIDDGTVLLGVEVTVEALLGALLHRVVTEAHRIGGTAVTGATLCHPAAWGPGRRGTLLRAAAAAGLDPARVRLVPEPVAAAAFHLRRHGPAPADLLVYDLGAGTFDVAVVRAAGAAMEVLCSAGLDETGGQDVDAAIVDLLRRRSGSPQLWARLDNPGTVADRAARRQLWDDVRNAKEMLSRTSSAVLYLPLLDTDQILTRDDLEGLAAPLIQRTVAAVVATLAESPVPLRPLGAVILVGGASRMPLVATMLHRALGIAPTVIDQPELVVAAGSIDPMVTGSAPVQAWPAPAPTSGSPYPLPTSGPPQPLPTSGFPYPAPTSAVPHRQWVPPAPQPPLWVPPPPPVPAPQPPLPQPPLWVPPPPPAPVPQPDGTVLGSVELIEIATPRRRGVTLRGQLHGGGASEHVFAADADGRLLLFADTAALARHAAADPADRLVATPPWQVRNDGSDDLHFDLELLVEHLSGPPQRWLPSFVCRCRDLCAQLVVYLDLDDVDDLLGEHSTIDHVDDLLRRHLADATAGRATQRKLARVDQAQLVEDWTDLVALIDENMTAG
jgi:hypothetical protein